MYLWILFYLDPAATTTPVVITEEPEIATESIADTEAIDAEYPTEEQDIQEMTTSEDELLSADAAEVQEIEEHTSENPIFNVELVDAGELDLTTEENKVHDEESELTEENDKTDSKDANENTIKESVQLSISSLEDPSDEPSVTYKIINGKHSESESEHVENNDDETEKKKYYNDGKDNEGYTSMEMEVTSGEIDYYTPKKGKSYTNYDERMSSDEAHKDESTEEDVDLFNDEKDAADDKLNPKFKMSVKVWLSLEYLDNKS